MKPQIPTLIFLSVILDAVSTHLGLWLGLGENGPLASRILPLLGPAYWLLELTVLLIIILYTEMHGAAGEPGSPSKYSGARGCGVEQPRRYTEACGV